MPPPAAAVEAAPNSLPRFGNFTGSAAASDLNSLGNAAKKVGTFASYLVNNPVVNNPLTRTVSRVTGPIAPFMAASSMIDKSGYQDPLEKALGVGNLRERMDAGNKAVTDAWKAGDYGKAAYNEFAYGIPTALHTAYNASPLKPVVEGAGWIYNQAYPASAQASPAAAPSPASPPPAAVPPVAPPPADVGGPRTVSTPPQNQSLSAAFPERFKGVPKFGDVVAGGNGRSIPLTAQEQNYNAEVLRGMQLANRARELSNVDRYRATQLKDRNALATLNAVNGGPGDTGHTPMREQQDDTRNAIQEKLGLLDERRNAVQSALFDPNDTNAASKVNRARSAKQIENTLRELLGMTPQTLEEMVQQNYGRTYDPKTGYFKTQK
jgi:hypothetical protein